MAELKAYLVTLQEPPGDADILFVCMAEDDVDAKEQALDAHPDATIIRIGRARVVMRETPPTIN